MNNIPRVARITLNIFLGYLYLMAFLVAGTLLGNVVGDILSLSSDQSDTMTGVAVVAAIVVWVGIVLVKYEDKCFIPKV